MIKKLVEQLKNDPELYYGYQSNIAMKFIDECASFKKETNKKYLNKKDIHFIANESAKNFLDLLIT